MSKTKKEREIEEAIRLTWSSLESHLRYTYAKSAEGTRFHKKCTQEYARVIEILSGLL
jgi:hypothetical protein